MNKQKLIDKIIAWEEWGKAHPQKLPKTLREALANMRQALMFQPEFVSDQIIADMKKQFNITMDVTQETPKETFGESSVVVDINILTYAKNYLENIEDHLDAFENLYKAALNLKLCTNAETYNDLSGLLKIERADFVTKFIRSFAKEVGIDLINESQITRLRNQLVGDLNLFEDFERSANMKLERQYAIKLAATFDDFSTVPGEKIDNDALLKKCYRNLLKSNWLTAIDGFKNWCHYAIIKNHLAGHDDFLGYHIYRGRGGEGKTVEVKALKNWAVSGNINFYEGSSKDVRAGFMSRAVPDALLSAIQEETGFEDEKSNEVRKALGDIGGLIPTEKKFRDAETVISRTVCTSTTNDRRIYPQRKFLQIKFGRIDKTEVPAECVLNPQRYADQFVKAIMETIPVGEKFRPFYTQLWQYLAKLNETTLINDYWNSVFASWIAKNYTVQLDHQDNTLKQGYVVEERTPDGVKDVTAEEKLVEIGMVKLMNDLMGPQRDQQADYFSRLSQCENFINDFAKRNPSVIEILSGTNNKQVIKFYPARVYNVLKASWDEVHNNNKQAEEEKLLGYLTKVYTALRNLACGADPETFTLNLDF